MAIQRTEWGPDTCSCRVLYSWDDALPERQRVHTLVQILNRGPEHALIVDDSLYAVIREESTRKNRALGVCAEQGFDTDSIPWSYDEGRTLHLSVPGTSTNQRRTLSSAIDAVVGLGLVVVS